MPPQPAPASTGSVPCAANSPRTSTTPTLARDLAALARRFQDLDKDIEELEQLEQQYGAEIEGEHHHEEDAPFDPSTL